MTSALAPDERRRHPRSEIVATATILSTKGNASSYLVENLSAGGALLVGGDDHLEPGARVRMLLHLPERKPLSLSAVVIRRQAHGAKGHGLAVNFQHLSPEIQDVIQEVVLTTLERLHDATQPEVLVIDDSLEVCRALERDLRAVGRRSVWATNTLQGLKQLETSERRIDAAIVDLRLGNADGLEFLDLLSQAHPSVRRILMSGSIRLGQLELALPAGRAHAVIEKPWSREVLKKALSTPTR